MKKSSKINPNSDRNYINNVDLTTTKSFQKFVEKLKFNDFRHIKNLTISFNNPISVISGINKTGKSSILVTLACSHVEFMKRNQTSGNLERQTWSSLVRFTKKDIQLNDWTYHVTYKEGTNLNITKRGQRKANTRKWNGIAKREGQIGERQAVFIDLDRTLPARFYNNPLFKKSTKAREISISSGYDEKIEKYISYILEENFKLKKLATHQDKDIFTYHDASSFEYSSYNAATGEEVLIKMIIDITEADKNSLILIDEIEIGLHPKVQRRLMDILFHIARYDNKQFILTTHSPTILSSVSKESRIFIDKYVDGNLQSIQGISINSALSKMDSHSYPLLNVFCEDNLAKKIISIAIEKIHESGNKDIHNLINIIDIGPANEVYDCFLAHKTTYGKKIIRSGYACILDGDMRNNSKFKQDDGLFFLFQNDNPEKTLVSAFAKIHPEYHSLSYHLNETDNHTLFQKIVELRIRPNINEAIQTCLEAYLQTNEGRTAIQELIDFLNSRMNLFAQEL